MARVRRVEVELAGGIDVEYVRRRRMLRLRHTAGQRVEAVEVPVRALFDQLGIEAEDVVPARHYLLFSGRDGTGGGLSDVVGVFQCETKAREAFRRVRLSPTSVGGWAELAALTAGGRLEPVCWFGTRADLRSASPAFAKSAQPARRPRTGLRGLMRPRLRQGEGEAGSGRAVS